MSIKVSVIIATYNYGAFIAEALSSVEAQTFRDWECIVIDDASTDGTHRIVKEFVERDERFKYIQLDHNGGVSNARNIGLAQAQGEHVQLLDADDLLAPGKLESHVTYLQNNADVDVVYSDFYHFTTGPDPEKGGEYSSSEKLNGTGNVIIARLLKGNVFRMPTLLFRRSVLASAGHFNGSLRYVEDLDFWFRVAAKGHGFHFLEDPKSMSGVRRNPFGLSTDLPRMRGSFLPVLQNLWNQRGISFKNRLQLLIRYIDASFEAAIVRRERIRILNEGKLSFVLVVSALGLIVLPFWLLSRPFRSR